MRQEERDERKSRNLLNILLRERDFAREAYEKFHTVVVNGSLFLCVVCVSDWISNFLMLRKFH